MTDEIFWVVIPAFNSAQSLPTVIRDIQDTYPSASIVAVDDGSSDQTYEVAAKLDVFVIRHEKNHGVGAAIKTGIDFALSKGAETIITIGADNQRDVGEIKILAAAVSRGEADMAIGSRFQGTPHSTPLFRKVGNIFLTRFLNRLFGSQFSDVTSGFRALNRKTASDLEGLADRYPFDADLCIRSVQKKYKTVDIPVKVYYGKDYTRMRSTALTGLAILFLIVRRRLGW